MPDFLTRNQRSARMAAIRSRGNKETELVVAKLLRQNGITGWRRNLPVFGKPDFVFRKARLAVFVDGCFWHGCPKHCRMTASNRAFWRRKLSRSRQRDLLVNRTLRKAGWRVLRVWEHQLHRKKEAALLLRIQRALNR